VLIVGADTPHKSFGEFMAFAKANPGKVSFGSQGQGSQFHLALERLKLMSGTDIVHVPYKGGGLATIDVLAGRVPLFFDVLGTGRSIQESFCHITHFCISFIQNDVSQLFSNWCTAWFPRKETWNVMCFEVFLHILNLCRLTRTIRSLNRNKKSFAHRFLHSLFFSCRLSTKFQEQVQHIYAHWQA
jgi:hypothetical protein